VANVGALEATTRRTQLALTKDWTRLAASTQQGIVDAVTAAMAGGLGPHDAAKAMTKGVLNQGGLTMARANTIARTETVGAYVQGDLAGARALGDSGPVEKVWVAAIDARTRPSHEDADGQCVPIDDTFDVGGEAMDAPHDPSAPDGEVVNCRCIVEFLYVGDTRPDGTTVEGPDGEDDVDEADVTEVGAPVTFDA
jgi:uncharacterized protein with gpF-like domain